MRQKFKRLLFLLAGLVVLAVLLHLFGITRYFTLESIQFYSIRLKEYVNHHYATAVLIYIAIFTLVIAAGIPAVAPLTMLGGFLFNVLPGALFATIGGTIGSIFTFFIVRYLLGSYLQERYTNRLRVFNQQMREHGAYYILMVHFLSIVPYFVINSLAALTVISLPTFIWTTFIGSLPLSLIYSFAGQQLATIKSVKDIFSPSIILLLIVLVFLAFMPIIFKRYKKMMRLDDEEAS